MIIIISMIIICIMCFLRARGLWLNWYEDFDIAKFNVYEECQCKLSYVEVIQGILSQPSLSQPSKLLT